jgi:hypothetical protein
VIRTVTFLGQAAFISVGVAAAVVLVRVFEVVERLLS